MNTWISGKSLMKHYCLEKKICTELKYGRYLNIQIKIIQKEFVKILK